MTTYKKLTWDSFKIQVESAVRDGNGATISTTYATKSELTTGLGNKLDTTTAASTYLTITNASNTYAPLTKLTDGSVTKVGTANVGTDTKPIKLVSGVPTAVANDLVDTATAQTITAVKTHTESIVLTANNSDPYFHVISNYPKYSGTNPNNLDSTNGMLMQLYGIADNKVYYQADMYRRGTAAQSEYHSYVKNINGDVADLCVFHTDTGDKWAQTPYRGYDSGYTADIVTIGSLAFNPSVIHATGNETKLGNLTLQGNDYVSGTFQQASLLTLRFGASGPQATINCIHDTTDAVNAVIGLKDAQNKTCELRLINYPANNQTSLYLITRNGTWHQIASYTD